MAAALAAAVGAAFSPVLQAGFVNWDDDAGITENPNYRGLSPTHLKWMFTTPLIGHYQPLAWLTLGIDFLLWGMNPLGYHLTSLLIHAANTVLCFFVILALIRQPWAAAAGAVFWGLHPLRVESVAWVTERKDVICGFFFLLSVLAYLRMARERAAAGPWRRWWAVSCAFFGLSLLSKSLGIMLPFALLILDAYPLRRTMKWTDLVLEKTPYLVLSIAAGLVTIWSMGHLKNAVRDVGGYPAMEVILNAAHALCFYILKMIVPTGLYPFYPAARGAEAFRFEYVAALAMASAITLTTLAFRRRAPWAWWTWCAFAVLAFPTLGFFTFGNNVAGDRYTYLACLPPAVLLAAAASRFNHTWGALALAAILGPLAFHQAGIWKDSMTLWNHELSRYPAVSLAYANRGTCHRENGDYDKALADFNLAVKHGPDFFEGWYNRGLVKLILGDAKGAVPDFDEALRRDPGHAEAHNHRGLARALLGEREAALTDFDRALELDPLLASAHNHRGLVRPDPAAAIRDFDEALRIDPDYADAYYNRALRRLALGDKRGAAEDLKMAIEHAPGGWRPLDDARRRLEQAQKP